MKKITRRAFLAGVASLGLGSLLSVSVEDASAAEVNRAWSSLVRKPIVFEVDEFNTITVAGIKDPEIRADVYDISTDWIQTIDDLIHEVKGCYPLTDHFRNLSAAAVDDWQYQLLEDDTPGLTKQRLRRQIEAVEDLDDGWKQWVRIPEEGKLSDYKKVIDDWLADSIDWNEIEWFASSAGGQGAAYRFFQEMPYETLEAMGVVIVEGDHPGSSYFAAELRQDVSIANQAAEQCGWPVIFKK